MRIRALGRFAVLVVVVFAAFAFGEYTGSHPESMMAKSISLVLGGAVEDDAEAMLNLPQDPEPSDALPESPVPVAAQPEVIDVLGAQAAARQRQDAGIETLPPEVLDHANSLNPDGQVHTPRRMPYADERLDGSSPALQPKEPCCPACPKSGGCPATEKLPTNGDSEEQKSGAFMSKKTSLEPEIRRVPAREAANLFQSRVDTLDFRPSDAKKGEFGPTPF